MKFSEMNLSEETLRALSDLSYKEPTPIQQEAISWLMQGYDLIGQSQTGSGKTAAFGIPVIERVESLDRDLQAVILCPTRELCIQSAGEIRRLLKYHAGIRVIPIYGGEPIDRQIQGLKGGVQIVVATPGRFIDHMNRHTIKLKSVQMVVLDEADEMLKMGFLEDMETILSKMPAERQTALFSATMPEPVVNLAGKYLKEPKQIHSGPQDLTVASVEEAWFDIKEKLKPEAVSRLVEYEQPNRMLIFCNTKRQVDDLAAKMKDRGQEMLALHGDLNQPQRDLVMRQFRTASTAILISTDVAARGIDVDNIDIVLNYDVPDQEEFYVHRIGRTARAGRGGKAYTFVVGRELEQLKRIMEYTGHEIHKAELPTLSDLESRRTSRFLDEIRRTIDENGFDHRLDHSLRIVERLDREGYAPQEVAAALIQKALNMDPDRIDNLNAPARLPETDYSSKEKVTLVFNIGRKKRIRVKDLVGAIAGETGISGYNLGEIRIEENASYVEVPKPLVSDILQLMQGATVKGYPVSVSLASNTAKTDKKQTKTRRSR